MCGPILNYLCMTYENERAYWHGSVLLVTEAGQKHPKLELKPLGPAAKMDTGKSESFAGTQGEVIDGLKLYADPKKAFWRFSLKVPLDADAEMRWLYTIPNMKMISEVSTSPSREFFVPAANQSMRLMFHSCNGFSVGTDIDFWSGPVLWKTVLESHAKRPFHVMIGGGDQIYNDSIRVDGPLKPWTEITNPKKRREYPFGNEMRQACDDYYFKNYIRWYSTEPFATANAQIPQINIWDDHDIIDGFGSYTDHFMQCAVFRGIGGVSFKYYCLFQHHTAPPKSTFTTDAPATMKAEADGTAGADPRQLKDTYVYTEQADDSSWIVGKRPGPYVEECSRSLYMRLGARMAFCGVDARTERTRKQVNYPDTYDLIFQRLTREFTAAQGQIKHLILLLGVPIAYPRLAWLENILSSPIIAPLRLLHKRFGIAGGFFNSFDGSVDLLDDLDDHYTARHHKKERRELVQRLQALAQKFSVRVTILGGDVHLAAMGRFYSKTGLNVPAEQDHRYMANVISSAITNKPPPSAVANLLARRNKVHHLDHDTDETLLKLFDKQPGGMMKGATWNQCTMPSRNYATITEVTGPAANSNQPSAVTGELSNAKNGTPHVDEARNGGTGLAGGPLSKDGRSALHKGEEGVGTKHPAADGVSSKSGMVGGLDISIQVEIDNHSKGAETEGYGFSGEYCPFFATCFGAGVKLIRPY
jgi:PhoD related phosphatase